MEPLMTIIFAISMGISLALLSVSVSKAGGIPVSLSSTYYALGKNGWIFQVLLASSAGLLLPVWIESSGQGHEWMAFISCMGLLFVAAAPAFRMQMQGAVHYTSAAVCCIAAVCWQTAEGLWDVTLWFTLIFGTLCLMKRKQWCWWMESAVIGSVYFSLIRMLYYKDFMS